jgi:8-oxo-dGTP diphosphatase
LVKRLYPKQPVVGVGAVIIRDGKILLEKRKNEPGRGKWSIPGGLVELGESARETAIREVREETRLEVEEPMLMDVVDNVTRDENGDIEYHFVILDYFVKFKGGVLRASSDAAELEWVQLSDVEEYDLTKSFRGFFERNLERLKRLESCV